jgi:8-oxo-dGTP diphosphatase
VVIDQRDYPTLFGRTEVTWAPIDARFSLLTGEIDIALPARVYIVPFIGDNCVVVGFDTDSSDWGPVGGGLEPGETFQAALERELREEAGARLRSYTAFGVLHCRSHAARYRPHLPHPDYDCLYGYGDVELVGAPEVPARGGEGIVAVEVLPAERAVALLAGKGRAWEADLYRLAATLRRAPS